MVGKVLMTTGASTYSSAIADAKNYTSWLLSEFEEYLGDKVLEVGLGHGGYKAFLKQDDYTGIDIDATSIEEAKQRDPKGKYYQADITQDSFSKTVGTGFDSVLCLNVLEHIKDDDNALLNLLKILKPGGHLLLLVPAHEILYTSMDKMAGHHRRYSKKMLLRRMPECAGLELVKFINPIGGFGWWMNKFANHQDLDASSINRQIVIFDKYILPISKMAGLVTKRFFGQSLICVVKNNVNGANPGL